jgi:hypothetical protein
MSAFEGTEMDRKHIERVQQTTLHIQEKFTKAYA